MPVITRSQAALMELKSNNEALLNCTAPTKDSIRVIRNRWLVFDTESGGTTSKVIMKTVGAVRQILTVPAKLTFLDHRVGSGGVSDEVIDKAKEFLHENGLHDVEIKVSTFDPISDCKRICTNPKLDRIGKAAAIVTYVYTAAFTPEFFTGAMDHYNVLTNTVHLATNSMPIALHECGHAKDFVSWRSGSVRALNYTSFVSIINHYFNFLKLPSLITEKHINTVFSWLLLRHEAMASLNVIKYLGSQGKEKVLYPTARVLGSAYMTYVANAITSLFINTANDAILPSGLKDTLYRATIDCAEYALHIAQGNIQPSRGVPKWPFTEEAYYSKIHCEMHTKDLTKELKDFVFEGLPMVLIGAVITGVLFFLLGYLFKFAAQRYYPATESKIEEIKDK